MGGGSAPSAPKPKAAVSYKKEAPRVEKKTGKTRRPIGAQYLSSRTATPTATAFGGTKKTLG